MTVGSALKDTEDVLMQVMAPMEKHLSGVVFRDAYCIGFLSGRKDGDLYMRYRLLHLAPEGAGKAALERFFDNVRRISSPASLRPAD
jgi:hypothetical protein